MKSHSPTKAIGDDLCQLAADAQALAQATAKAAGRKVCGFRDRIGDALDHEKKFLGRVRGRALHGTHVADQAMHRNPYPVVAIGIGLGVGLGAAAGYLLNHWWTSSRK